jgi:ATP-binding protein involved in chromosome partitioning
MFKKLNVPVLGVIENMAEFACPHCRKTTRVFSQGGAKTLSEAHGIPVLGSVPLDPAVCQSGETGPPMTKAFPDSATAKALREAARAVAGRVSVANAGRGEALAVREE